MNAGTSFSHPIILWRFLRVKSLQKHIWAALGGCFKQKESAYRAGWVLNRHWLVLLDTKTEILSLGQYC